MESKAVSGQADLTALTDTTERRQWGDMNDQRVATNNNNNHGNKSDSDYVSHDSIAGDTVETSVTPLLRHKPEMHGDQPQRRTRPTSLGHSLEPIQRQISTESHGNVELFVRHGSKHLFTVVNYGQTPIDECPPAPLSPTLSNNTLSSTLSIEGPIAGALKRQQSQTSKLQNETRLKHKTSLSPLKSFKVDPCLEQRIDIPTTPTDQPKHVSFCKQSNLDEPGKVETITASSFTKSLALVDIIRRGRLFAKRKQKRLVFKSGEINFSNTNVDKKSLSYFLDIFTTLLDLKWRYIVFIFIAAFLLTWIFFAIIWWAFVLVANDGNTNGTKISKCFDGVNDFSTALLFSVETQQTIGYGTRSVTSKCPLAIGFVMLQSLVGVLLSCVMTGLIFAKFSRPKSRAETILFSKCAVICERDGTRCLVFRVGDMRRTHMATVNIRAMLIGQYTTKEDESVPFYQHDLRVQTEADDFFFLAWPIKVFHKIDETSPLWTMSAEDLLAADFEIVVVLEGTNQTTGQTTQIRTSYLPGEMLWGHRLDSLITSLKNNNRYQVDYTRFHETVPVSMSENSAQVFEMKKRQNSM